MEDKPQSPRLIGHEISQDLYKAIEARMPPPAVSGTTTPQQCGFLLGIQFVMDVLRQHTRGAQ